MVASTPPLASVRPSGLSATALMLLVWPVRDPGQERRSADRSCLADRPDGETPSAPANVSATTTTNGSFDLSLPADSVTTLVVTAPASSYPSYTTRDAQTGR
jgi:hypothetical protein